jgi:hypothetical protein
MSTTTQEARRRPAPAADPVQELLATAADALHRAEWAPSAALRYELAYLCALRSGAAVLARSARPRRVRTRPRGIWALLAATSPELAEWAGFFSICGTHHAALLEGRAAVSSRQADDLVRDAEAFLAIVTGILGAPARGRAGR